MNKLADKIDDVHRELKSTNHWKLQNILSVDPAYLSIMLGVWYAVLSK